MAAGSNSLNLILDDNSGAFQYGPLSWTSTRSSQYYGSEMVLPAFAIGITEDLSNTSPYGSFSVTFEGISIAFVGNTPALASSQTILVTIDGGHQYETSYNDTTPASYMQWYQSPVLTEGIHTIMVDALAGTSLDYAVVTVGPNTLLTGMQIIVDNEDLSIQWSSGWTLNTDQFDSAFFPDKFAYGNSTRRSSTAGDAMSFRFQGTSVSIYGVFSWFNIGMISATFTLDNETVPQMYRVTADDTVLNQGDTQNFLFMTFDNLLPQDHTLVINITQCINQTFILDYITYTPSFSTLAEVDDLSPLIIQPSSITTFPLSTSTQPSPISTTSAKPGTSSSTSITSQVGESSVADKVQSKNIPVAAIVTAAIAVFMFIVALPFLYIRARRSTSKKKPIDEEEEPRSRAFPILQVTASNERQSYSGVSNRSQIYSPSGNVKMKPFSNYKQVSAFADRKQRDIYDHQSIRRNGVSSRADETINMPSSTGQSTLAPLQRIPTASSRKPSSSRKSTPSRPPPEYSPAVPRKLSALASMTIIQ